MNGSPARFIGPALALLGAIGIVLLQQQPLGSRTLVSWWVLERAVAADKALPLLGLGCALALLGRIQATMCVALFLLGAVLGFALQRQFIKVMGFVPDAADHLFLAGPISLIAAGVLLLLPAFLKSWWVPAAALTIGAMLAQIIALTDPTVDSWDVSLVGVGLGLWAVVTTWLCVRSFYRDWFPVGLRIVGSWLLAIGLLYGGSSFVPRPALPSLPDESVMTPPTKNALPNFDVGPSGPAPEELPAQP